MQRPNEKLLDSRYKSPYDLDVSERRGREDGMSEEKPGITIVGGVNIDIGGEPERPLIPADSNPGTVTMSMGGVGRNIAHNLRLLGQPVRLITVFGGDLDGQMLRDGLSDLGVDLKDARTIPSASTSTYLYITDENGEMQLAVADMKICDSMTPEFLAQRIERINQSLLCVMDTNLPAESIVYLAEHLRVPLFVDPVSTTKMQKLQPVLGKIHTFKPNRIEAGLLTGIEIRDEASLAQAADALLSMGVQRVFITLGGDGAYCADRESSIRLPGVSANVRSTTGGGDCFMAALAYAYRMGCSLEESGRLALAAGAICTEGAHTINEALTEQAVRQRAGLQAAEKEEE